MVNGKESDKKYREGHQEKIREYKKKWYINNRDKQIAKAKKNHQENRERTNAINRKSVKKLFNEILDHYGHECFICKSIDKLCVDHIGGCNKNEEYKMGISLWIWIRKNNFPLGFRILCSKCNLLDGMLRSHKNLEINSIDELFGLIKGG